MTKNNENERVQTSMTTYEILVAQLGLPTYKALTAYLLFGNSPQALCDLYLASLSTEEIGRLTQEVRETEEEMKADSITGSYEESYDSYTHNNCYDHTACWE